MGAELSFLEVNGVELSNQARVQAYLQRFNHPVQPIMRGWCPILDTELGVPASTPAADPAPWYSTLAPESADFLGVMILDLKVWEKGARPAAARAVGGFAIGAEEDEGETMTVNAVLLAVSPSGLAYGRSWLRSMLSEDPCNPCALSSLRYREACPPTGSPDVGEWILFDAGLIGDGVVRGDYDTSGSWWEMVSFTISSQHAWRFRPSVSVATGVQLVAQLVNAPDVIDFSTNPFTDGRLVCSPLIVPTAIPCPTTVSGGHLAEPHFPSNVAQARISFYRSALMADGSVVAALQLGDTPLSESITLVARWLNADRTDGSSSGIAAKLDHASTSMRMTLNDQSWLSATSTATLNGGLFATTSFTPVSANTMVWLRLDATADQAVFQLWGVDPYPDGVNLRSDVAPLRSLSGTSRISQQGAWGVYDWNAGNTTTLGYLDAFTLHPPSCMRFDEWLCGVPPVAADSIELAPTRPGGQVAAVVTLDATTGQIANAFVEAYHGACPVTAGATPFARIDVPLLVAGSILTIDSARERITLDDGSGTIFDGSALLELGDGRDVEWITAPACDSPICVRTGVATWCGTSTEATITVARQERAR